MDKEAFTWGRREAQRLFNCGLIIDVDEVAKWLAIGYIGGRGATREFRAELVRMAAPVVIAARL